MYWEYDNRILGRLKTMQNSKKTLVIMGAGVIGKKCLEDVVPILDEKFANLYFFDNDKDKQGKKINGYEILGTEELKKTLMQEDVALIIAADKWKELYGTCCEIGVEKNVILICDHYFFKQNHYQISGYSQEGEEVYLKAVFGEKTDGFYVDIGAHHPFRFSNTYWAYKCGWHGINIEPNADLFVHFEQSRTRDINLNCGVSSNEGVMNYYKFEEPAYNTFSTKEFEGKREPKEIVKVPVKRIDEILEEQGVKNIDFMNVDVEGLEMEVLQSNNWNKYRPTYILLEQRVDDLEELLNTEEYRFLAERGYRCVYKGLRTVIYRV